MSEDDEVRITLRLPRTVRDRVAEMAAFSGRSMNNEIVVRLEQSTREWFKLNIPEVVLDRAINLPAGTLDRVMAEISNFSRKRLEAEFERHQMSSLNLMEEFLMMIEDAPEEERPRLRSDFEELLKRAGLEARFNGEEIPDE